MAAMDRETAKMMLLEYGWDAAERQRIATLMDFVRQDAECQLAAVEYDRIRGTLCADAAEDWQAAEVEHHVAGPAYASAAAHRPIFWWRTAGVAAGLLMVLSLGWQYFARGPQAGPGERQTNHAGLLLGTQEVQNSIAAFRQVAGVFGPQTSWLLLGDRASDVGLTGEPPSSEAQLLVLRLVVENGGEVVSQSDLVIVPGQSASVTVPLAGGPRLHYEVTLSDDAITRLSLWAELLGDAGEHQTLAALATDLPLEAGRVFDGGEMATTNGNYALRIAMARASNGEHRP